MTEVNDQRSDAPIMSGTFRRAYLVAISLTPSLLFLGGWKVSSISMAFWIGIAFLVVGPLIVIYSTRSVKRHLQTSQKDE